MSKEMSKDLSELTVERKMSKDLSELTVERKMSKDKKCRNVANNGQD